MRALQLETVKSSLEEYKQRTHDLRDENEALKREREVRESEARQIISFLRHDAERKDELIESLRNTIEQQREASSRDREDDRLAAAKRLKESEDAARAREQQLESEVDKLQKELQMLHEFKLNKARLEAEQEQERRARLELEEAHKETVVQMERKFFEEKGKLQREAKHMLAEIRKTSQEEAVERLDASTKKVLFENRRMAEELRLQVQETDELQKLSRKREEENRRLRREVELNEDSLKEYAKQGFRQTREGKDLVAKVRSLEGSLSQIVKEYERKAQLAADSHERQVRELELESSGMRQLLKLKSKELANVKRLAQLILEKRNEVETFLLESIEEVKVRAHSAAPSAPARSELPPLHAPVHNIPCLQPPLAASCAGPAREGEACASESGGICCDAAEYAAAHHTGRQTRSLAPAPLCSGARRHRRLDVGRQRARAAPAFRQNQQQRADAAPASAPAGHAGRRQLWRCDGRGLPRHRASHAGGRRDLFDHRRPRGQRDQRAKFSRRCRPACLSHGPMPFGIELAFRPQRSVDCRATVHGGRRARDGQPEVATRVAPAVCRCGSNLKLVKLAVYGGTTDISNCCAKALNRRSEPAVLVNPIRCHIKLCQLPVPSGPREPLGTPLSALTALRGPPSDV